MVALLKDGIQRSTFDRSLDLLDTSGSLTGLRFRDSLLVNFTVDLSPSELSGLLLLQVIFLTLLISEEDGLKLVNAFTQQMSDNKYLGIRLDKAASVTWVDLVERKDTEFSPEVKE